MDEIGDIASKKIGGLPAWGWAAIIAGGVVIYAYWRNRTSAPVATGPVMFDGNTTASGLSMGIPASSANYGAAGGTEAAPVTLDSWISDAVRSVGGAGTDALGALNAFLAGQPLSASQKSIIDSVIAKQGLPPNYSSLSAAQPTDTSSDYSSLLNSAFQSLSDSLAQQQNEFQSSLQAQMDALSNDKNTLNIPAKTTSASSLSREDALLNAQKLAQQLNRSVQTAYGWVAPSGSLTSTDVTAQRKADAKAISAREKRPVKTAYGWITPNGLTYPTEAAARKAMGK